MMTASQMARLSAATGVLAGASLLGDALASRAGATLPGPVLGALILGAALALMLWRGVQPPAALKYVASVLLAHMGLLFIPAAVSVIDRIATLRHEGFALVAALLLSAPLGIVAAALTFRALTRDQRPAP